MSTPAMDHVSEPGGIPVISLFCGAGGLDLGFRQAGYTTKLALDHAPAAVASFNRNMGANVAEVADLSALGVDGIVQSIRERGLPRPRGVLGGPPCQGFSSANVKDTSDDKRNGLPQLFADCIVRIRKEYGLSFFVFENVSGLLREKHKPIVDQLRTTLSAHFSIHELELDAADFGVPQRRRRVIWVGVAPEVGNLKPALDFSKSRERTVRETIEGLPEPELFLRGGPGQQRYHPNHWTMQPKSERFRTGAFNRWRSFRKLDWDSPSPTVAYGNREIHVHPNGRRRLSVYEAMLLQGFPESFVLEGNLSEQVTQVSNAVPPPVAREIAVALKPFIVEELREEAS